MVKVGGKDRTLTQPVLVLLPAKLHTGRELFPQFPLEVQQQAGRRCDELDSGRV